MVKTHIRKLIYMKCITLRVKGKWDETEYASELPFQWFAKYMNTDQLIA
jgi:hypothetical protein